MAVQQQSPQAAQLLSQIRDIRGLDYISWWPIPVGWWYLLAFILVIIVIGFFAWLQYKTYKNSWKAHANYMLQRLANDQRADNRKEDIVAKLAELSGILKYIAIKKYGRDACAGLEGEKWLKWLSDNDPAGFDWQVQGRILLEAPYAPPQSLKGNDSAKTEYEEKFTTLLKAAEKWVR